MDMQELLASMDLNPNLFTGDHWSKVGQDMVKIIEASAGAFVKKNMPIAVGLSSDEIKGLLYNAIINSPSLPQVPDGCTDDVLKAAARICLCRLQGFALTSEAQKQKNTDVAQIEQNAKDFAIQLGGLLVNAAFGALANSAVAAVTK